MDKVIAICQILANCFKGLFFLIVMVSGPAKAQCVSSNAALESGIHLYERKQFLLSLQEFSLAEKFDCKKNSDRAKWGYLLALTELNERDEMFFLANEEYPKTLSPDYAQKLKVYKSFYFSSVSSPDFSFQGNSPEGRRVKDFQMWKNDLMPLKSPALAGTLSAFLPGAGQLYDGTWQAGAMAFVLNALFLSATLELEDKGLHRSALVGGLIFSITYVGNIFNAAESARVYNQNYYKKEIDDERDRRFPELTP